MGLEIPEGSWSPATPLYRCSSLALAAGLGGPLAAGWVLSRNFARMERPGPARLALGSGIALEAALVGALAALGDRAALLLPALPVASGLVAWGVATRWQGSGLRLHASVEGRFAPWWRALVAGLAGLAVTAGLLLAFALEAPPAS